MTFEGPILVVAAHPDDEVLGCGGTMARLAQEGEEVHIALLGEGVTSRFNQRETADAREIEALHGTAGKAAEMVGAKPPRLFGLPDNRFDLVPLLDIVKQIESLIFELQPKTVFTQHGGDLNIDHKVTHRAVMTATRPFKGQVVRNVMAYEVASSTEWAFQQFKPTFRPNLFVDISQQIETKIRGMAIYESESREFPHPRSGEALRAIAKRWGSVVGVDAAEAFEVTRSIC
jgi:LmbE family N-acetylglucosaminyl deacetylase